MKQHFKVNGKRGDVKHNVKVLLELDPSLRDDLLKTICNYWRKIDVEKNPKIKEMITLPGLPSVGCFKSGEPQDLVNVTKEEAFREFVKKNILNHLKI